MNYKTLSLLLVTLSTSLTFAGESLSRVTARGSTSNVYPNLLIAGFTLDKPTIVVVRGLGPSLGIDGYLPNPAIGIYDANSNLIGSNDNWNQDSRAGELGDLTPTNEFEAATVMNLPAGSYVVILSGLTAGIGAIEVYDVGDDDPTTISPQDFLSQVLTGGQFGPRVPVGWKVIGLADFNGDGKLDYALFNPTTRQTAIWYLTSTFFVTGVFGPTLPPNWTLIAVGDFNGDGHPDYLLYSPLTRQTAVWYLR